jgi:protoporphyrinogen oxidase
MILILGGGLSGVSASFHIGHSRCLLIEKSHRLFGHIGSEKIGGFIWDQGPHVSFTKSDYVRQLFSDSVSGDFEEFEVCIRNYFNGQWIDHPAQTALYQIQEPLRSDCVQSFLQSRFRKTEQEPKNYLEWLEASVGEQFAKCFSAVYTRKYWTVEPNDMSTAWIGGRVLSPSVEDFIAGSKGPLKRSLHYINKVRYPRIGGYQQFAEKMAKGCNVRLGTEVVHIDLVNQEVYLGSGEKIKYSKLVNTLPLPVFVQICGGVPHHVREAVSLLSCTQLLLVNVEIPHPSLRPEHWIYVYDQDKFSTRINTTEMLSKVNAPKGWTGVQVEVYFSKHRPMLLNPDEIAARVMQELVQLRIADPSRYLSGQVPRLHTRFAPWANIIFNHYTKSALETIWNWLNSYGLIRSTDDIHPLRDWALTSDFVQSSRIFMAGRFAQWKHFWSDDCVLRGRELGLWHNTRA